MENNQQEALIQDKILGEAMETGKPITVYLTRGNRITGYVKAYDRFCILLEVDSQEELIFKHAISTIVPQK